MEMIEKPLSEVNKNLSKIIADCPKSDGVASSAHNKAGLFATAAEAIQFAVHSSACEGMTTPREDVDNLWSLARGEISADALIRQYISEAIEEDGKLHAK